ncbi:MAG: aldo/keto reductase, partial [Planctomycetaceae bacterium]|nr:aldo/keto reductase [Planctomycetaceae bacterium]
VQRALDVGINWIDTAAGYGQGQSEASLGRALQSLGAGEKLHVATKVRITPAGCDNPADEVRRSVEDSLQRLQLPRVTLLQLHNAITPVRGEEAASITPEDVLRRGGVLEACEQLRDRGLVQFLGLTGTGRPESLRTVLRSGRIDTAQVPFHLLNPSAGRAMPSGFAETDFGLVFHDCRDVGVGVFAIRVFAAGALLGNPPSAHTKVTPYFPLALYERDCERGARIAARLGLPSLKERAIRYALSHPAVTSGIIGFGSLEEVGDVAAIIDHGMLTPEQVRETDALVDAECGAKTCSANE